MACRLGGIFAARRGPEAGSCRDRPAQVFVIRTLPLGINRRVRSLTLGMSLKGLSPPVRFNKKTGPLAKQLTAEQTLAPKPFVRKDPTKVQPVQGWSPSTVRSVLTREIYHGVLVWNRSQKRPAASWGQV